ncbi:hypothetical protein ACQ4M3_19000 [Leptolyngbya sp. AN03gr2]|uniref:hypothetical protein n=1 Tax=Leptolyngbya sp. AN03gr2 TaxID=3423364 RepID=UPI003D312841
MIETASFYPDLGAPCHQRVSGATPVCAVTTLKHNEILFSNLAFRNNQTSDRADQNPAENTPVWAISEALVYLQRFWATSTARITLTCHLPSASSKPPLLPIYQKNIGSQEYNFRLQPEDEICVYFGYINGIRPVTPEDIKENRLLRVYTGVVDTLSAMGTPRGIALTISCRDRIRYLMDTFVSLSPLESGAEISSITKALGGSGGESSGLRRSDLILKVAQMGIGYIELQKGESKILTQTVQYQDELTGKTEERVFVNINGKRIERGFVQDLNDFTKDKTKPLLQELKPPDFFYRCEKNRTERYIPLTGKTVNEPLDINPAMRFNIIVGRLGFETENLVRNFSIENQIPIEFIKFLANQEPYPTEMFMNHSDGQFYYTPRSNDGSGLSDPKRFYRTYYFRNTPDGMGNTNLIDSIVPNHIKNLAKTPAQTVSGCRINAPFEYKQIFGRVDQNQMLINFKEEFTTAALKTNFIVANAAPSSEKGEATKILHLAARPSFLRGREIAGRTMYIIDQTISNHSEAAAIAASVARATAKELKSASMTTLGDPSLVPGEVIQVIGSPLYPESLELSTAIKERHEYTEYEKVNTASYYSVLEALRIGDAEDRGALLNIDGTYDNTTAAANYDSQIPDPNKKIVPKAIEKDSLQSSLDVLAAVTKNETSTVVRDLGNENRDRLGKLETTRQQLNQEKAKSPADPVRVKQLEDEVKKVENEVRENTVPKDYKGGWDDNPDNPIWRRSGFTQEPRTIWRIEGVKHSFGGTQRGFTTEVALLSAFN